jgi:quercetin dioxygenase-like cupin family protein
MAEQIYAGNAADDGPQHRDWVLGHFMPADDARHSDAVEIKWAVHPRGDKRADWVTEELRTAAIFLVSGRFRVDLPGRSVVLARQGDYVVFHGVGHSWVAEEDSTIVCVRWPSVPGYASSGAASRGAARRGDPVPE